MKIQILTDSSCDLPIEYIKEHSDIIQVVSMPIQIDGEDFSDDFGKTSDLKKFYNRLREGAIAKTSQIVPAVFETVFEENQSSEIYTIYVGLSSQLSGTFSNAILAKNLVEDKLGQTGFIFITDNMSGSIGTGVSVMKAVELIKKGFSAKEINDWLEKHKRNLHHWFAVDDLQYLKRGGRISHMSATVGGVLNIKPVLTVNEQGHITMYKPVRGRKKSIKLLANQMKEYADKNMFDTIIIGHGDCYDDAMSLKEAISEDWDSDKIIISELSYTISTHVGPNMLALSFWGYDNRKAII